MTQSHKKMGFHRPHKRVHPDLGGPSRTKQSFKKECDINEILRQFHKSGVITHVQKTQGQYQDFINGVTYHQAMNVIADANSMFETVPAKIRAMFDNDPAKFLDFVQNDENEEQMRELGLLQKAPEAPYETQPLPTSSPTLEQKERAPEAPEEPSE